MEIEIEVENEIGPLASLGKRKGLFRRVSLMHFHYYKSKASFTIDRN